MKGKKLNFTIIELLMVISVIFILASLLLPSLKQARNKASTIVCTSNLKQMGQTFHLYGTDFNGMAPPFSTSLSGHDDILWSTLLWPYLYGDKNTAYNVPGYNGQYSVGINKKTIFACPSRDAKSASGHSTWFISYGLNYRFAEPVGHYLQTPYRFTRNQQASKTAAVIDSYSACAASGELNPYILDASKRHSNGNNVLYSDMHAAWKKFTDFPSHDMNIFWRYNGVN